MRIPLYKTTVEAWWINCIDIGGGGNTCVCLYGVLSRFVVTGYDSNGYPTKGTVYTYFDPNIKLDYYPITQGTSFHKKSQSNWRRFWSGARMDRYNLVFSGENLSEFIEFLSEEQLPYGYNSFMRFFGTVPERAFTGTTSLTISKDETACIASKMSLVSRRHTFHSSTRYYTYARYDVGIRYDDYQPYIVLFAETAYSSRGGSVASGRRSHPGWVSQKSLGIGSIDVKNSIKSIGPVDQSKIDYRNLVGMCPFTPSQLANMYEVPNLGVESLLLTYS